MLSWSFLLTILLGSACKRNLEGKYCRLLFAEGLASSSLQSPLEGLDCFSSQTMGFTNSCYYKNYYLVLFREK